MTKIRSASLDRTHICSRAKFFSLVSQPLLTFSTLSLSSRPSTQDEVIDYRSHVSGVFPDDLKQGCTLEQAREALCRVIFADTIVVGHSLHYDLVAMRLQHWNVIDTAMLFSVPDLESRTFSLKVFGQGVLGREGERKRERERHTKREAHTQRERHTQREAQREKERNAQTERERGGAPCVCRPPCKSPHGGKRQGRR